MANRNLIIPDYTRGEETFNMTTHIVGASLGLVSLIACVIVAAYNQNVWGIVSGCVYGFCVILLFTISSVYHGLVKEAPKRVLRIIDHCSVFILIAGTYTPVLLNHFRVIYPWDAWIVLAAVWGLAIAGIIFNMVDLERFRKLSLFCYLGMGWLMAFRFTRLLEVLGKPFFILILIGGVVYTIGVFFYVIGKNKRYMHSVFHLFVNVASILHSIAIIAFIMPK